MAALVLGLLLASAETQFDTDNNEMTETAAGIAHLDVMLATFGPESAQARAHLRHYVEGMRSGIWPDNASKPVQLDPRTLGGRALYDDIEALTPQNDAQRELKTRVTEKAIELGQSRWLLLEQAHTTIPTPFLVVVTCWLAIIFFSYGLFAPPNLTVITLFITSALSVSAAIYLIMDLNTPFDGMIQISSKALDVDATRPTAQDG